MSIFLDEETGRSPTGKQPALVIPAIHGVLPFSGSRNPLTRTEVARRVSTTMVLPAANGQPRIYHFESAGEHAVALDACLDPRLYDLEAQLSPIRYYSRTARKYRQHHFDLRLTFDDGLRRAVFVRNGASLARPETQAEIEDIFIAIPPNFADEAIVVNCDHYTRAYRDNLFRIWEATHQNDPHADTVLENAATETRYWSLADLISNAELPSPRAFAAGLRLIGRRVLAADWHSVICIHSRVQLNA